MAYTLARFRRKVSRLHPGYKIKSVFSGVKQPLTYYCDKGHRNQILHAEYLFYQGCKQCGIREAGKARRLKPYRYIPLVGRILRNTTYVVPPPFNTYKMTYLGKGKWKLYSRKGTIQLKDYQGYYHLTLYGNDTDMSTALHHIVYAIKKGHWRWRKKIGQKFQLDHRDRNPHNNRPSNIRLVSKNRQMKNTGQAKITDLATLQLIFRLRIRGWTLKRIAERIGCHLSNVAYALNGATHQDLREHIRPRLIDQVMVKQNSKRLTQQEHRRIFRLKLRKWSNADIAIRLGISPAQIRGCLAGEYYQSWFRQIPTETHSRIARINARLIMSGRSYQSKIPA